MDPVTHTLAGACLATAFFRKGSDDAPLWVMAAASNLPDVDALVYTLGGMDAIALRRTFGHSLLTAPLWSAALAAAFKLKWPARSYAGLFGLCLLAVLAHLGLDLCNTFGVTLLWPLSDARPELAVVFIVDLVLVGLFAGPLLDRSFWRWRAASGAWARAALAAALGYLGLCWVGRQASATLLARETASAAPGFSYVFPEPLGPLRWRGVTRSGGTYRVYLIRPVSGSIRLNAELPTLPDHPAARAAAGTPAGAGLGRFFKAPVWSVREEPGGSSAVRVYDLRFQPLNRTRPFVFDYSFTVRRDGRVEGPSLL
ncbi:MAG: metal-dependent hydrolase [Elusimicrobia bacterium]|nr:metal-dependent hydrolase [Elusimicrobiota bacterium]